MDQQHWQRVETIVNNVLDLEQGKRDAYIEEACNDDHQLKKDVTELLENITRAETENYLEETGRYQELEADLAKTDQQAIGESLVGQQIDTYHIVALIKHGGMGSVYLAERADELFERQVALKILPRGMDTPSNIERFNREQQILAKLDHPNIGRLLDGGITQSSLPYLVMEYIDGIPIHDYCDKNCLTISERIDLFKKVCKAVHHAHANTVIHRDLKPSNILVTGNGKVKVLDFGIAKILDPESSEASFQTRTGSRTFTLGYAAPEQIAGDSISTAADCYGLGILLYELLSGRHPIDLDNKSFTEAEKTIRNKSPVKPEQKFSSLSFSIQKDIAEKRNMTPKKLVKLLQGDLSAIIMKALRKEPGARYLSTEQFLEDLKRWEQNLPLIARKDTLRYKTGKFIKRHATVLGFAVTLFLLIGSFTAFYAHRITQERNRAELEAEKARQTSGYLLELFNFESASDTMQVRDILQKGVERTQNLKGQTAYPNMLSVMGQAYMNIGDYEKAYPLLKKALTNSKKTYGEESLEYATALYRMANWYKLQYNSKKAFPYYKKAYQLRSDRLGLNNSLTAQTLTKLGTAMRDAGKLDSAEIVARRALSIQEKLLPKEHPSVLQAMANLAYVLRKKEEYDKAETLYLKAINIAEKDSLNRLKNLSTYYENLGYLYKVQGKNQKATTNYRKAIALREEHLGSGHPKTLMGRRNLATNLYYQERYQEAEQLLKKNIEAAKERFSANHRQTISALNIMSVFLMLQQKYAEAEPYLRKSLEINKRIRTEGHPKIAYAEGLLAASLKLQDTGAESTTADSLLAHQFKIYQADSLTYGKTIKRDINRLARIYNEAAGNHKQLVARYNQLLQ